MCVSVQTGLVLHKPTKLDNAQHSFVTASDHLMDRLESPSTDLQWSSKVCIQNQSLLGKTVGVRRQLNLTGGTVR